MEREGMGDPKRVLTLPGMLNGPSSRSSKIQNSLGRDSAWSPHKRLETSDAEPVLIAVQAPFRSRGSFEHNRGPVQVDVPGLRGLERRLVVREVPAGLDHLAHPPHVPREREERSRAPRAPRESAPGRLTGRDPCSGIRL